MGMDIEEELAFSAFHSISAFCNAGFSTLYGNLGNELVLHNHNLLYITISFLVILGGIGFPILVNLYETVSYESKRLYHRYVKKNKRTIRKIHLYNLNTRIVLIMTAILLVTGTVAIVIFEWNHAFAGMTVTEKWVQGDLSPYGRIFKCGHDYFQCADVAADGGADDDWRRYAVYGRWCEGECVCCSHVELACYSYRCR